MAFFTRLVLLLISLIILLRIVNGECRYTSLMHVYKSCAFHHRTMESLYKHTTASGQDVVDVFNAFCAARPAIHTCVEDYLHNKGCSDQEANQFRQQAAMSEWFCVGDKVKPFIEDTYKDIGAVGVSRTHNECMKVVLKKRNICQITTLLAVLMEDIQDPVMKKAREVTAITCVLNVFGKEVCPMRTGVIYTTLAFGQSVVPPVLGVNVSSQIVGMDNFSKQGRRRNVGIEPTPANGNIA